MNKKGKSKNKYNGVFVLSSRVSGNPYYPNCIQAHADKKIKVRRIVYRQTDANKNLLAAVSGKCEREEVIPLSLFNVHPPIEKLRARAEMI